MDKTQVINALKRVKESSIKRNFKQTYDLIVVLKEVDIKKDPISLFTVLHYSKGKKIKVCALVGPELLSQAKEICDGAVSVDDFSKYTEKAKIKKLANSYDFFIAQATIMPKIATAFGRVFGPKGKMPNPKSGCVVPPTANLKPLYEKLQKTIKLQTKDQPIIQCAVGLEDMKDEEVIDNILTIYDALIHSLANAENNIKEAIVKLTMGSPVKIGEKVGEKSKEEKKIEKPRKEKKKEEKQVEKKNGARS